jgi:hypothetical protein
VHKRIASVLAIVIIALSALTVSAQTSKRYSIAPSDTLIQDADPSDLTIFDIYQRNISTDTLQLSWFLLSKEIPEGWEYSMCDLGHCYASFPSGPADMFPADPDEEAFLGLNIHPHAIAGTAVVRVYVYDKTAPAGGDTLTWIIRSGVASVDREHFVVANVAPNPFTGVVHVQLDRMTSGEFELLDVSGVVVRKLSIQHGLELTLDLSALPAGSHFLRLTGSEVFKTLRLIKY